MRLTQKQLDAFTGRARQVKRRVPTEGEVQSAILSLLWRHPKVAYAGRYNSGRFQDSTGAVYKFVRLKAGLAHPDILGLLGTGKMFALECKRPGWKSPHNEREKAQERFLGVIRDGGGIGAFVTSVDEVVGVLGL